MGEIITIGLDLAKSVFQVHAVDEVGRVVVRRQIKRARLLAFFADLSPLWCRHGGLFGRTLLGAGAGETRARGPADAAILREAPCQARQDGCCGRGGDLRGRQAAEHARHARGVLSARRRSRPQSSNPSF